MENDAFKRNTTIYNYHARYLPAIITSIPALVFLNLCRLHFASDMNLNYLIFLPYIVQSGLSVAAFYMQIQFNRVVSKEIFQRTIFKGEINLPTTKALLWCDDYYDKTTKTMFHKKIKELYGISLPSITLEKKDKLDAQKKIIIAVSQIRNTLRGNAHVAQHNREYGFIRNLIGGSLVAFIISVINIMLSTMMSNTTILSMSKIAAGVYLIVVLLSKPILVRFGQYYADSLFNQFLMFDANTAKM